MPSELGIIALDRENVLILNHDENVAASKHRLRFVQTRP